MLDELYIDIACIKNQYNPTQYKVDFSYLNKYQNIHFIFCLMLFADSPNDFGTDFELILPSQELKGQTQFYKILSLRHRNTQMILEFLKFWQKNSHNPNSENYPRLEKEQILDKDQLPPLLEGLDYGVIWIWKNDSACNDDEIILNINDIFHEIKDLPPSSVTILYEHKLNDKGNSTVY